MKTKLLPSLLSAPFYCLGEAIHELEEAGADLFHYDVMDGHFVPNLTVGPLIIESLAGHIDTNFDVHLMVTNPEIQIPWFDLPAVRSITIHIEASADVVTDLNNIRQQGKKAGISLNPETPVDTLDPILHEVDQILIMAVNPGFPAQVFMKASLEKIEYAAKKRTELGLDYIIQVDGGINPETISWVRDAGAEEIVAGNAIFNTDDPAQAYKELYTMITAQ